jgi:predicted transcriptional regulator
MAKPKKSRLQYLQVLAEKPMTINEIANKLNISRKTEWKARRDLVNKGLIKKDAFDRYSLTILGKSFIESSLELLLHDSDYALFAVYTQVLDPIKQTHDRPPHAWCRLYMKDAKKIKEQDERSRSFDQYLSNAEGFGLEDNSTNIKKPAAALVDSILDLKAKDIGLNTILDFEYRDSLSISNVEDKPPGYDDLKRRVELANTNFKILIEFDGRVWAEKQGQKLEDLLSDQKEYFDSYRKSLQERHDKEIIQKIDRIINMLPSTSSKHTIEHLGLFKNQSILKDYLYKLFEIKYAVDKNKINELIQKAYNCGLFEESKRTFVSLK